MKNAIILILILLITSACANREISTTGKFYLIPDESIRNNLILTEYDYDDLQPLYFEKDTLFLNIVSDGEPEKSGFFKYNIDNEILENISKIECSFMYNNWAVFVMPKQIEVAENIKVEFINIETNEKIGITATSNEAIYEPLNMMRNFAFFDGEYFYFTSKKNNNESRFLATYNIKTKEYSEISDIERLEVKATEHYIFWCDNNEGQRIINLFSTDKKLLNRIDLSSSIDSNILEPFILTERVYFYTSSDNTPNKSLYSVDLTGSNLILEATYNGRVPVQLSGNKWILGKSELEASGFIFRDGEMLYSEMFSPILYINDIGVIGINVETHKNGVGKGLIMLDSELLEKIYLEYQ